MAENHPVTLNSNCRVCDSLKLRLFLDLGTQAPANAFLKKDEFAGEASFPLRVAFCESCGFVQLADVVDPDILFRNYVYVSSTSPSFVKHFEEYAEDIVQTVGGATGALAVDIGSNDGILLKPLKALGARVLGIDPATAIAKKATADGIETWPEYFGETLAEKIKGERGDAKLITANNVFAHIHDLNNVARGVKILLSPDGAFVIEAPDLSVFLSDKLFDTVYHEHVSYISVTPLISFFARHGLQIFDVKSVSTHGGSLRIFVGHGNGPHTVTTRLTDRLQKEQDERLGEFTTYEHFASDVLLIKQDLLQLLNSIKSAGGRIAGYGAPAKGNTLLNYMGIGTDLVEFIVDDSPPKQGLFTPGMHIPVVPVTHLDKHQPDYLLILAWNFAEAIMKKNEQFAKNGGKFIVPVPVPRIVDSASSIQ